MCEKFSDSDHRGVSYWLMEQSSLLLDYMPTDLVLWETFFLICKEPGWLKCKAETYSATCIKLLPPRILEWYCNFSSTESLEFSQFLVAHCPSPKANQVFPKQTKRLQSFSVCFHQNRNVAAKSEWVVQYTKRQLCCVQEWFKGGPSSYYWTVSLLSYDQVTECLVSWPLYKSSVWHHNVQLLSRPSQMQDL